MAATIAYMKQPVKTGKTYKIAFLTACTSNAYCQAQIKGAKAAAAHYHFSLKVFDANFTPATELKNVQDAVSQGFDGYLFTPVAETSGCADYKLLKKTGKPIVTANSPMCGNQTYTKGTVGFVAQQTQTFFNAHVANAFKSCTKPCEALALGGFVGSDLFTRWERAIKLAEAKYPNVKVDVDQPGNFDPQVANQKTSDALSAHPNITVVVSSWDDMTRGAVQAISAAGKSPGKDVRIYSIGATKNGVASVKSGQMTETSVLLPYEETYYPLAQLIKKLSTGKDTPGFANLTDAPAVAGGPGSIFITALNAAKFKPEY
jgi:ABC-type sugar transport system substrate-binding protein